MNTHENYDQKMASAAAPSLDIVTDSQPEDYDQKMASAAAPSPDIVTDSQPEVPDSQPENPVLQTSDALETSHGSGQKFKEIPRYKFILPYELKEDIMHILIICADKDRRKAERFKSDLEAQVKHPLFKHKPVNVKLLDDIMTDTNELLDFAFQQSVCILLFATASFEEERWPSLYGLACLKAYLEDPNKNWCVIPVHTAPKKKRDYKLPLVLDCDQTRGFEYWPGNEKNFCQLVKRYMEAHSSHILEKERKLEEERNEYIEKNREELDKTLKYYNEYVDLRSSSVGENRPDVSEEVAQINISDPQEIPRRAVGTKYHIFISYCWAQQEMVLKLVEHLKALKYKIWFDLDCMSGSTVEAMAKGVEESSLVIICVSANYKKSKNCKLEAEYSYQKNKQIIPVIVEEKYRSDGWLGAIMGVKLYFNLASDFDEQIKKLCTEIDRHLDSQA